MLGATPGVRAQGLSPVFTDDSPLARDTLVRLLELRAGDNLPEAVRALQRLLDEESDRVLESSEDPDLFQPVRRRVHDELLADEELLASYRLAEGPVASAMLAQGELQRVERTRLLTDAGFEAALRLAQMQVESASFDAAGITLAQLDRHPSRRGEGASQAASLATLLARYAGPAARARAERWCADAGEVAPPPDPVTPPAAALSHGRTSFDPGPSTDPKMIVAAPMKSIEITPRLDGTWSLVEDDAPMLDAISPTIPSVEGDRVYANDGLTIGAWDRFTLAPIWSVSPTYGERDRGLVADEDDFQAIRSRRRVNASFEDATSVTLSRGTLLATTGIAFQNQRVGDPRLHALDADTGSLLWSADVASLDPSLEGASIRGAVAVSDDVVIVATRRFVSSRRLLSAHLIGVDLATGAFRWSRLLGTAGSLPHRLTLRTSDMPAVHEGVVYAVDQLGIIAAIEASSGRPVWIRRMAPSAQISRPGNSLPFASQAPIVRGRDLMVLSPARDELVRLDRETGAILQRIDAARLGNPAYMLVMGDDLALVGVDRVAFLSLAPLDAGEPLNASALRLSAPIRSIAGRATPAGGTLLIPTLEGLVLCDPASPRAPNIIPMDHSGNVLPVESQVLVAGPLELHSYVAWEVAADILGQRMRAAPDDPQPALTLAELSYRAGRHDALLPAVDHALSIIERAPTRASSQSARLQLYTALLAMVEASQARWFADPAAPDRTNPASEPEIRDLALLGEVIDRVGRLAREPEERVSHLLTLGRLHEAAGSPLRAAESYQRILAEPALASTSWQGGTLSVRADLEATRRIERVVAERGIAAVRTFDDEARQQLDGLDPTSAPERFEAIASRYPATPTAAHAWLDAATIYEDQGRGHLALRSLQRARETQELVDRAGAAPDAALRAEVLGRLVSTLADRAEPERAARLLDELEGEPLTRDGIALDRAELRSRLAVAMQDAGRLPVLGIEVRASPQALVGWSSVSPMLAGERSPTRSVLMLSGMTSEMALWRVSDEGLTQVWKRPYRPESPPMLLRHADDSLLVDWIGEGGGTLERIDARTGETLWTTGTFDAAAPRDPVVLSSLRDAAGRPREITTPLEGPVSMTDILVVLAERSIVKVERSGRMVAWDLSSGALLWSTVAPVRQVHDVTAGAGAIALGGMVDRGAPGEKSIPTLAVLDLSSGGLLHRMELPGSLRWIRMGSGGEVLAGLDGAVACVDSARAALSWVATGDAARMSVGAWVVGDQLVVEDASHTMWLGSIADGRFREQPLETRSRAYAPARTNVHALGDRIAVMSRMGFAVFDRAGELVALDALDVVEGPGAIVEPELAEGSLFVLSVRPDPGTNQYALRVFETDSGRLIAEPTLLELGIAPRRLMLLDGRVLVTAGNATVVYRCEPGAPAPDAR
ncbi:MAG: PQQ-binding-like beta-propeller repeat protein [Phycisphaerales bacterium]|jgi:outer membrane protein assembly factor BamB/tetratricopeptide (TPR) repeat protein|nr:PQQ-binding-like beta-propeller repeat protein [Phycisphaerales bacterium]